MPGRGTVEIHVRGPVRIEDDAEALRIDSPAHDVERVRPGVLTAQLNGGVTFTNGTFTSNGLMFSASVLQPNATVPPYGYFLAPDSTRIVVSSGSLTFTLNASVIFIMAE